MISLMGGSQVKQNVLSLKDISVKIRRHKILKSISFDVKEGEIIGLLGSNGAGKTTLLKSIIGIIPFYEGKMTLFDFKLDHNFRHISHRVGVMFETTSFYEYLTVEQNLRQLANLSNFKMSKSQINQTLATVGLDKFKKVKVSKLSSGMKQRLNLAQAIMQQPDILLLDEPTNAMDELFLITFYELLLKLSEQGMTIIIASHRLEDISTICQRLIFMNKGEIVNITSLSNFVEQKDYTILQVNSVKDAEATLAHYNIPVIATNQNAITVGVKNGALSKIVKILSSEGVLIRGIYDNHTTLESEYRSYMLKVRRGEV